MSTNTNSNNNNNISNTIHIRRANIDDAQSVNTIWNDGIKLRSATMDTEPHTIEYTIDFINKLNNRYGVFVGLLNNIIVGFVALYPYNIRTCYNGVASLTIYVAEGYRGAKIGQQLLSYAHKHCKDNLFHKITLIVLSHNTAAQSLYTKASWRIVGTHIKQGKIDGKWVDTVIMEKLLIDHNL